MESPLEVLSRAATMVQDNSGDTRLTSKELPTTKWRRDRRIRMSSEYHSPSSVVGIKPLTKSNLSTNNCSVVGNNSSASSSSSSSMVMGNNEMINHINHNQNLHQHSSQQQQQQQQQQQHNNFQQQNEAPLDMSVSSKPRSPPPPYREPLPGSMFASTLANATVGAANTAAAAAAARPSVITQAPKRELISNQENKETNTNGSSSSSSIGLGLSTTATKTIKATESISMIDPVIDEHFRRSLGADYIHLFGNKNNNTTNNKLSSLPSTTSITSALLQTLVTRTPSPPTPLQPPSAATKLIATTIQNGNCIVTNKKSTLSPAISSSSSSSSSSSPSLTPPELINNKTTNIKNYQYDLSIQSRKEIPSTNSIVCIKQEIGQSNLSDQSSIATVAAAQILSINENSTTTVAMSVDDHFAKALGGDTWKQLQRVDSRNEDSNSSTISSTSSSTRHCVKN